MNYETLIQPVMERATKEPERLAFVYMGEDGSEKNVTALEFDQRARKFARALQGIGVGKEDMVILVLRHSETLLYAFWGGLYMGAIVSIFPFLTEKLDPKIYFERVKAMVAHSAVKAVITFPEFKDELTSLLSEVNCAVLSTDDVETGVDDDAPLPEWEGGENKIAFLQHSSGTTGLQKGVALTHRAVLNQVDSYSRSLDLRVDDVIVSWLPLYHDMGLIAGFVMPIVAGIPLVIMSPFQWIRDPKILFQAITAHRATLCWLPNFAYNHLARVIRPRELPNYDLRSIRAFINCSEPVRHDSHRLFLQKFAAIGVREEMLQACYAMAENTFAVTQTPLDKPAYMEWVLTRAMQEERKAIRVEPDSVGATSSVSCGYAISGTEVAVVDEKGNKLPERSIGELILRSDCMLSEYYKRPDATSEAIRNGWYFTGDMGYIADGNVFVSGRRKDLIIVGGKNIYPQDLEAIANVTPGIYPGRAVAFGMMDANMGSEVIVMVCEMDDENTSPERQREIEQDLRQRVVQQSEVALKDLRLVGRKWLIKTSSGKIARSANRDKYLETLEY
jgi:fatty-acyl-CoA synthase